MQVNSAYQLIIKTQPMSRADSTKLIALTDSTTTRFLTQEKNMESSLFSTRLKRQKKRLRILTTYLIWVMKHNPNKQPTKKNKQTYFVSLLRKKIWKKYEGNYSSEVVPALHIKTENTSNRSDELSVLWLTCQSECVACPSKHAERTEYKLAPTYSYWTNMARRVLTLL